MNELRRAWMLLTLLVANSLRRIVGPGLPERRSHTEFAAVVKGLAARAPEGAVESVACFDIPATQPPWIDTGIELRPGQQVSLFATGHVLLSRAIGVWFGAKTQLWYRVGDAGEIAKATAATHTFRAAGPGRLYISALFGGDWADDRGALATPLENFEKGDGGLSVAVIQWSRDAADALEAVIQATASDAASESIALATEELAHIRERLETPAGWSYFWEVGAAEIYSKQPDENGPVMHCHTKQDAGILQKDVDCALTPSTRVRWNWNVGKLPSRRAEDTLPTHDYLSVAFEFENGRDLSYFWSSQLPSETSFHCPLPSWQHRETHFVLRSGSAGLGDWQSEERNLYADYQKAIGEPPARITRVWFIAVSVFQRGEGEFEVRDIVIENGDQRTVVL